MDEKEKIYEVLDTIPKFCESGNCDFCAFRTNSGMCKIEYLAETHPDSMSELNDW